VDALREEAARADAEGQSERAALLLGRAMQEPVDEVSRARLAAELASVEVLHAPEQSDLRLVQVMDGPGSERIGQVRVHAADLLLARGNTELVQHTVQGALTSRSLSAAARTALEALYWLAVDGPYDAPPPVRQAPPLPERPSDPAHSAAVAWQLLVRGQDLARTRELARAALTVGTGEWTPLSPRIIASRILLHIDGMAEAEAGLDAVLVDARQRRARSAAAWARLIRANLGLRKGNLDDAGDDIDRALALLPLRCWHPMAQPSVLAAQIALFLEAGQLDRAKELVATELPPGVESGLGWCQFLLTKGLFQLLTGDPRTAVEHLQEAGRRMLARQWVNPALAGWRSFAALAHRACGNAAEAERLVTEERALAERWGIPSALGGAHLAASMVLDGPAGLDSLTTAVDVLRESPSRLRHARALLRLAELRRAAGESGEAVQLATEAGELARANGAHHLANQARELGWDPLRRLRTP
jgi:tetratricopeptide (TPR) repeat protein